MKSYFSFINEDRVVNFTDPDGGNFVVLMGGPGSGKSSILNNLINLRNIKVFNVDTERELVAKKMGLDLNKPEDNDEVLKYTYSSTDPKNRTIKQLKSLLNNLDTSQPVNIVFDTVGTHVNLIRELLELAKSKAYVTTMIYVHCDIDSALDRNRKRARKLSDDVVIDYHTRVQKTFDTLFKLYDHAWVVDNSLHFDLAKRKNIVHQLK